MTTTEARTTCYFVPPYVEAALAESPEVPSTDQAQLDLSDAARQRRAAASDQEAEPDLASSLAPPATGTSRREVYDSGNTTNQRVKLVRPEGSRRPRTPR